MPSNLSLGALGRATGANGNSTSETTLGSDCAGTTSSPVKMSEFTTEGGTLVLVTNWYTSPQGNATNDSAGGTLTPRIGNPGGPNTPGLLFWNFSGLTNTPGEPGYRFNRIGTTPNNFTYARVSGVYNDNGNYIWAHSFSPSSDLDWDVNIDSAANILPGEGILNCSVAARFYDYGYNSGASNYNIFLTQLFHRTYY